MITIMAYYIKNFKNVPRHRKISIIFYLFAIFSSQIIAVISVVNLYQFSHIITQIEVPSGSIYFYININDPINMTVEIPYKIPNSGISDMRDIQLGVNLELNYINKSNHANITSLIFSRSEQVAVCHAMSQFEGLFKGDFTDFFINPLIIFYNNVDIEEDIIYIFDLGFRLKYFWNLLGFSLKERIIVYEPWLS